MTQREFLMEYVLRRLLAMADTDLPSGFASQDERLAYWATAASKEAEIIWANMYKY